MTDRSPAALPRGATARTVAQAKLNLFLHVLAREASGYHQLETLFCRLELGDDVSVRTDVRGRTLDCGGDVIPPGGLGPTERNLAWRAATEFVTHAGWPNDWAIEITKRIPVGGGLGGGSADAGAVLRCLNALAPHPVSSSMLLEIAASIGADVPFVAIDSPLALAWGRGERILELPALPSRAVTLVCFPFGVSTPDAFAWVDAEHENARPSPATLRLADLSKWSDVARQVHNDFERVVTVRHPQIARALETLRNDRANDAEAFAFLTGSGSTVALVSPSAGDHARAADGRLSAVASRLVATRIADAVVGVEVAG